MGRSQKNYWKIFDPNNFFKERGHVRYEDMAPFFVGGRFT